MRLVVKEELCTLMPNVICSVIRGILSAFRSLRTCTRCATVRIVVLLRLLPLLFDHVVAHDYLEATLDLVLNQALLSRRYLVSLLLIGESLQGRGQVGVRSRTVYAHLVKSGILDQLGSGA